VAAVERAFAVLDSLADGDHELGTNEIARRTGINASTVSRLLATLAGAGFVERVSDSGRYRLGLRLLQLGNAVLARLDLREVARPHLTALAELTGETVSLSAPDQHEAITVDFVQSASTVQSVARVGRPSVAHATSVGKVLLAFGAGAVPGPLVAYTSATITSAAELAAELEEVRARGWARAVLASNAAGAVLDTLTFLWLAGFPVTGQAVGGQLAGKLLWATLLPVLAVTGVRRWRRAVPRDAIGA
jgi:IclR family acetate operon transcriptional repressor